MTNPQELRERIEEMPITLRKGSGLSAGTVRRIETLVHSEVRKALERVKGVTGSFRPTKKTDEDAKVHFAAFRDLFNAAIDEELANHKGEGE